MVLDDKIPIQINVTALLACYSHDDNPAYMRDNVILYCFALHY